jgi:dynactin-5
MDSQFTFYPVRISDFVHIGKRCIIEAAQIGSGVEIGDNCIIVRHTLYLALLPRGLLMRKGKFVIIKDLAVILPDTVLPEGTVVPSFSVWSGNPGTFLYY